MMSKVERLLKVLSYTECKVFKLLHEEMDGSVNKNIIASVIADNAGVTRSVLVNTMRILEATGVINTFSMGMKGMMVNIIDVDTWNELNEKVA